MLKIIRRVFSFTDWAQSHPTAPPPGDMLDAQFDEIIDRVDIWEDRIRRAVTPEGRAGPGTVGLDALDGNFRKYLEEMLQDSAKDIAFRLSEYAISTIAAEKRALEAEKTSIAAAAQAKITENALKSAESRVISQMNQVDRRFQEISAKTALSPGPTVVDEEYHGYSEAWARTSAQWAEHMPDTLPESALVSMDVSGDHWSAKWWANRADNAFGRLTDLYLGAWPDPPTTNLEGGPITTGSIYYNTDTGQMYVWDGDSWNSMTQPARAAIAALWYSAAEGQTVFPFSVTDLNGRNYALDIDVTEGVDAHVNGVKLMPQDVSDGDWTLDPATSTVTFLRPLRAGDIVSFDILMSNEKLGPGAVNSWSLALTEAKDGTRTTFTLDMEDVAGPSVTVNKNEGFIVSLDGVIQEPGVSYNASGSSIVFSQAPAADSWVFITWFRSEGGTGVMAPTTGVDWADITGKPSTFPPTLPIAQSGITNLVSDLAGKALTVHTHVAANVTDFSEAVDDRVNGLLVAGTNVTLTYNDTANTMTIAAAGGGGGSTAWADITGKPSTFPPTVPIAQADITNLVTDLGNKLNTSAYTAADVLAKMLTVDGTGSNLDADLLDGQSSAYYATASSVTGKLDVLNGTLTGYTDVTSIATPATPSSGRARLFAGTAKGLDAIGWVNTLGVPLVITRDRVFYAKNSTGGTLTKGTAVYISGASGGTPLIAKAQADAGMTKAPCVGLVIADILNNGTGAVMTGGVLSMDTSAFTDGARLYVSATTAGVLTSTMPAHPAITQTVGVVEVAGVGTGSLLVSCIAVNPHQYDGVNGASWAIGDATGAAKSLLMKNAAGTGTLSWNPSTARTLTLPDATATLATTTDVAAKLDSSAYTAADVLTKIKTVDSTGSGLDADLLDAQSGAYYLDRANHTGTQAVATITGLGTAAVRNIHVGTTAPGSPATNDIWIDTT